MKFSSDHDYVFKYWRTVDLRNEKNNERRELRIQKIQALINDPAATEGEKNAAREALIRMS
jgi:hypothetical protein